MSNSVARLVLSGPVTPADLVELAARLAAGGTPVVIGDKYCPVCGARLGAPVPDAATKKIGQGPTRIFLRVCHECFEKWPK